MSLTKITFSTLCALALVGCASTAAQPYRPAASSSAWEISGRIDELSNQLLIKINGREVINGRLSLWDSSGEFSGSYENNQVTTSCAKQMGLWSNAVVCHVFVNNDRAAMLKF
jgi:hypothetical protein